MASLFFNSLKVECELQIFKRENIYQVDKVSVNDIFKGKLHLTLNNLRTF